MRRFKEIERPLRAEWTRGALGGFSRSERFLLQAGPRGKHTPEKEGAQKLGEIEKQIGREESVNDAIKNVGISEQTYCQWKEGAGQAPESNELKVLVKFEEENARLKKLLARCPFQARLGTGSAAR
jgi:hypothetical protein